jgi:hypothetical protein
VSAWQPRRRKKSDRSSLSPEIDDDNFGSFVRITALRDALPAGASYSRFLECDPALVGMLVSFDAMLSLYLGETPRIGHPAEAQGTLARLPFSLRSTRKAAAGRPRRPGRFCAATPCTLASLTETETFVPLNEKYPRFARGDRNSRPSCDDLRPQYSVVAAILRRPRAFLACGALYSRCAQREVSSLRSTKGILASFDRSRVVSVVLRRPRRILACGASYPRSARRDRYSRSAR